MHANTILKLSNIFHKSASAFEVPPDLLHAAKIWVLSVVAGQVWRLQEIEKKIAEDALKQFELRLQKAKNAKNYIMVLGLIKASATHKSNLENANKIIGQCKNFASGPATSHQSKAVQWFPVQLAINWKYLNNFERASALGILKEQGFPSTVPIIILFSATHPDMNHDDKGMYDERTKEIYLKAATEYRTTHEFTNMIVGLSDTLRHELQHLCQELLATIKAVKGEFWVGKAKPTKKLQTVINNRDRYSEDDDYYLTDIEYYPQLQDSINEFLRLLPYESDHRKFFKFWIGVPEEDYEPDNPERNLPSKFLVTLKYRSSVLWRKAVKELWKAYRQRDN